MNKDTALGLLGGSISTAAEAMRITPQAFSQWPETLPPRLEDRVVAAIARKVLPPEMIGGAAQGVA